MKDFRDGKYKCKSTGAVIKVAGDFWICTKPNGDFEKDEVGHVSNIGRIFWQRLKK